MANIAEALSFINAVDISDVPRSLAPMGAEEEAKPVFDQAKDQAQVVGSGLFSFAKGVDAVARQAISDSTLLAQLVANKKADFSVDPKAWFVAYLDVLSNIGWSVQDKGWQNFQSSGTQSEVSAQIVPVIAAALAPGAAAMTVIKAAVDALTAMQPSSSWLTIFNRDTKKASIGRFQVGLVEKGADDDLMISLIGFIITATNDLTQVLFFKLTQAGVTFAANASKASLDREDIETVAPAVRAKVSDHVFDYVSKIGDL